MRRLALAIFLLSLLPVANAQETLRERIKERMEQRRASKDADLQTLEVQGRKVLVHLPKGFDASKPAPLVLAFHGGGGHAEHMAENYGLTRKADEAGFVVAFPNGYSKFPGGKLATWNAGGCCGDARDKGSDDVGFARAVVAAVQARWHTDPARVFATGMSNGGMLSHRLACEAADLFRAVAAVAGTDATASCTPSRPIAVLHIHAKDDTHVLFNGGAGADAFRDTTKVMDFVSVPDTIARWVQRDRCTAPPRRTLDVPGATCEAYSGCAGDVQVQLCVTDTGGHSWPGAPAQRRGKAAGSTALDANEQIWRFFEASARSPR